MTLFIIFNNIYYYFFMKFKTTSYHFDLIKDSERLLKKYKIQKKENGIIADVSSFMGIKMEMLKMM